MTTMTTIASAAASAIANDCGGDLRGRGHIRRCTSTHSAALAEAGVRFALIASGGKPSRAFPLSVVREIERLTGKRLVGKRS